MDKELLYRFFKNEVSQEEAFAIQEWMESSDETRKAFFTERRLFDTLILSEKTTKKGRSQSLRLWARYAARAAAVLLIAVAGAWMWSTVAPRSGALDNIITVAEGQRFQFYLSVVYQHVAICFPDEKDFEKVGLERFILRKHTGTLSAVRRVDEEIHTTLRLAKRHAAKSHLSSL